MRHFRKRIGLIHELGQLTGSEEFLDYGRDRLGIDEVLRSKIFGLCHGETLFYRTFHPDQANAELVFYQFTDGTNPTVAKVIDIIRYANTVLKFHQSAHHIDDVLLTENAWTLVTGSTQATVQFHPTHG